MRRCLRVVLGVLAVVLLTAVPLSAEQKNVKVLKGLSDFELTRTMQVMRASLGVGCDYCHAATEDGKGLDFASDAKKEKETARKMIEMVHSINADNFKGRVEVSCNSCHRGAIDPVGVLPLPQPLPPERRHETAEREKRTPPPTRDEVVAQFSAAIGKPSQASWESRKLTGTREGNDGKPLPITVEEAPGMEHISTQMGETTLEQAATATGGWSRGARGVRELGERDLATFHMLVGAFAPPLPDSIPADARVFRRSIDGQDTLIVFFRSQPDTRVRLEIDPSSGLPRRRTVLVDTPVGIAPTQTDFEDWRDVNGVKFPFTVRVSPYDPRFGSTRRYTAVTFGAKFDEKVLAIPK